MTHIQDRKDTNKEGEKKTGLRNRKKRKSLTGRPCNTRKKDFLKPEYIGKENAEHVRKL
jgi:hypothetical protein